MTDTIHLQDITNLAYDLTRDSMVARLDEEAVRIDSARWIVAPCTITAATRYAESDLGVALHMTFESDEPLASTTYMCAKAMIYALYTACIDQMKRRAKTGKRWEFTRGDTWHAEITVGDVTITLHLAIAEYADGKGRFVIAEAAE